MEKVEFKPNVFSPGRLVLYVVVFFTYGILFSLLALPYLAGQLSITSSTVLTIFIPMVGLSIFGIIYLIHTLYKDKLIIENSSLIVTKRYLTGKENMQKINLSDITAIDEKKISDINPVYFIPSTMAVLIDPFLSILGLDQRSGGYFWVFTFKNGSTVNICFDSWDWVELKKLIDAINKNFTQIKWNTIYYKN